MPYPPGRPCLHRVLLLLVTGKADAPNDERVERSWTRARRGMVMRLAGPVNFGLIDRICEIPEYVILDRDHDAIVHLSASEYILGPGYEPWEARGDFRDGKRVVSAYPGPEGADYEHLTPIVEALWADHKLRKPKAKWPEWESTIEGQALRWPEALDFDLLERDLPLPESIELDRRRGTVADRYTWASIRGQT